MLVLANMFEMMGYRIAINVDGTRRLLIIPLTSRKRHNTSEDNLICILA